jgi:hypothetical protein
MPDLAWWTLVDLGKYGIEAPQAAKAGTNCNLGHRQVGTIDQALGALDARGLCDLRRSRAEMLLKRAAQMPRADAETRGHILYAEVIEGTIVDQADGALDRRSRAFPRW